MWSGKETAGDGKSDRLHPPSGPPTDHGQLVGAGGHDRGGGVGDVPDGGDQRLAAGAAVELHLVVLPRPAVRSRRSRLTGLVLPAIEGTFALIAGVGYGSLTEAVEPEKPPRSPKLI